MTITQRRLTTAEAEILHAELKTTPNILGYTVHELFHFQDVLVAEENSTFAGACICKDLLFGWTEIAVIYVLPAYRGGRIASRLFTDAFDRARERDRKVIALSRSPEVIVLMKRAGMEMPVPAWRAPFAFQVQMAAHMSSWYRFRESVRKADGLKAAPGLVLGIKR